MPLFGPSIRRLKEAGDVGGLAEIVAGPFPTGPMASRRMDRKMGALAALVELGTAEAQAVLVEALERGVPWIKMQAAIALKNARDPTTFGALLAAARPGDGPRTEAIDALAARGEPEAIPVMLELLADPSAVVRQHAAQFFGKRPDPSALEGLLRLAADPDPMARWGAADGLSRLDDPRAAEALRRLGADPDERVRIAASFGLRQAAIDATLGERERLTATPGPRFGEKPDEPFLGSKLRAYLTDHEALGATVMAAAYAPGTLSARPKAVFPPVCSSCMEPTDRTEGMVGGRMSWTWADTGREITVSSEEVFWPVPLCERCASYGLFDLLSVGSEFISVSRGWNFWVRFRFPNAAYIPAFLHANGLDPDTATAHEGIKVPRMGGKSRELRKLEEAVQAWAFVRDGLGFHRYAQLKHRLEDPTFASESMTREALERLAAEFDVPVEQLRDVERIAQHPIPVLKALDR